MKKKCFDAIFSTSYWNFGRIVAVGGHRVDGAGGGLAPKPVAWRQAQSTKTGKPTGY